MSFRSELHAEPWRFDLLATLRRLEREHPDKPRIGDNATLAEEFVIVAQNPYVEFPDSNLEAANTDAAGRIYLYDYQNGINPTDYYNGVAATLSIVQGGLTPKNWT